MQPLAIKTMNFLKNITAFIHTHTLIPQGSTVILGLSGGPDSVFLLHVLAPYAHAGTIKLIAAHLDHGWRPESAQDVEFCRRLTQNMNITFVVAHITDLNLPLHYNGSHEEVGRTARRHFFEKLAQDYNANCIALAHHRNDQEETFFIRLIRGASLSGLTAMKPRDGFYIRPLLETTKADIIGYLAAHNITYLTDATNTSDDYLRNRLRNYALPALHASDKRFSHNFSRTLQSLQETDNFIEELARATLETIVHKDPAYGIGMHTQQFLSLHHVLQQRLLMLWLIATKTPCTPSQGLFKEIIRFMRNNKSTKHQFHKDWSALKKGHYFYLAKEQKNAASATKTP